MIKSIKYIPAKLVLSILFDADVTRCPCVQMSVKTTITKKASAEQSSSMQEILPPKPTDDNEGWQTVLRRSRHSDAPPAQSTLEKSNPFVALGHDSEDAYDDEPGL